MHTVTCVCSADRAHVQYFWGVLSDRWGRKPVILVSNVITALAGVAFGLAPNLGFVIGARMLGGLFNGSGV